MPTVRAALLLAITASAITCIVIAEPDYWSGSLLLLAAAIGLILLDAARMTRRQDVALWLDGPRELHVGEPVTAAIGISAPGPLAGLRIAVESDSELLQLSCNDTPGDMPAGEHRLDLHVMPRRRGSAGIPAVWAGWKSPLGLASTAIRVDTEAVLPILPNIVAVRRAALTFSSQDSLHGNKPQLLQGNGSEFDALRDYVPGLDHRSIDWKHTARHRALVCKEFRTERNHQIIIAIDNGRLMGDEVGGITKLDHAVTGALQLGFIAGREGDRFGLYAFNADIDLSMPPVGGRSGFQHLQRMAADIGYTGAETNFTLSLTRISADLNRRSLIVVITDFEDTITAGLMMDSLARLTKRHLVLFVTFSEQTLDEISRNRIAGLADIGRAVVADTALRDRQLVFEKLRRFGVDCIETTPDRFGSDLLNRYISIKQRDSI